jgi:alkylhydroperoxidase/carboxymuconolactone decarboxylase family protein YurZ
MEKLMASVKLIDEKNAVGKIKAIYEEIRLTLDIDFIPNMYKAMAVKPDFLEANWNKIKTVMQAPGKLDALTKEIIAVAVSAVMGCNY